MKKDFNRENVLYDVKSPFRQSWKPFSKIKKDVIKNVNELLVYKKEYLIPKKDLIILNNNIIDFIDNKVKELEREELVNQLTDLIMTYCLGIIREQNIINFIYR